MSIFYCKSGDHFVDSDLVECHEVDGELVCQDCIERSELEHDKDFIEWVRKQQKSSLEEFLSD